jgi:hypothetical protein
MRRANDTCHDDTTNSVHESHLAGFLQFCPHLDSFIIVHVQQFPDGPSDRRDPFDVESKRRSRCLRESTVFATVAGTVPVGLSLQFERLSRKYFGQDRDSVATFRWICDVVAERKMRFYPHLNVAILDVYFTRESAKTIYFEVAYSIAPNTDRQL